MLANSAAEVLLSDGRILSSQTDPATVELRVSGDAVQLAFRNPFAERVGVEQLRPVVAPRGWRGLGADQLRIGGLGWQSWSRAYPPAPFESNTESAGPPIRGPYLPHRGPDSQVEPWMATLVDPSGGAVLLGFVSSHTQLGCVELLPDGGIIAASELEGLPLPPGAELVSEPLLVLEGDEPELRARYAEAVAKQMHPRLANAESLSGWCSWYQLYTSVSEQDVRRNLANLTEHHDGVHDGVPVQLIQLDDGYQHAVGDWLELNDKFPGGLRSLASDIRAAGFIPGVWLAPFLLSASSHTYATHSDWVIRDPSSEPINALHNWGSANYCLDTTHPEAMAWICKVVDTVVHAWGFDYLKLDFLYAAALRGVRHERTTTSVEAYRDGMRRIREVAGDRFILASGAPMLPSIGLVDGMRIGSDVASYWGRDGNADGPALSNALRATLARGWLHGRWWSNDPDCVLVRANDSALTLEEVQAWAAVVALSGGMLFVGDDVSQLEPDRLAILGRLFPPSARAAEVLPPLHMRMPQRLVLRFGDSAVVGIANWTDATVAASFDPTDFGLPAGGGYHLFDQWSGAYLGLTPGVFALRHLPPHALHLLTVHPDSGHPRVVGTTGHLLGDCMDVLLERWDPDTRELLLTPSGRGPRDRHAEIVIADSDGFTRRLPFATANPKPLRFACG